MLFEMGPKADYKIRADFPVCFILETLFRESVHAFVWCSMLEGVCISNEHKGKV